MANSTVHHHVIAMEAYQEQILPLTYNMFPWLHLLWLIIINYCQEIRVAQKAGPANVLHKTYKVQNNNTYKIQHRQVQKH